MVSRFLCFVSLGKKLPTEKFADRKMGWGRGARMFLSQNLSVRSPRILLRRANPGESKLKKLNLLPAGFVSINSHQK